jgi:mono/diheme cytochrome c family protein
LPEPPPNDASDTQIADGKNIFYHRCAVCHGASAVSGGVTPDLRFAAAETHSAWDAIVLGGSLRDNGMPAFGQILSKEQSDAVHAFVIYRSQLSYERQEAAKGQE